MKNLCSENYLLILKMFSKKRISENVIIQNAIIFKKIIKMKKKLMSKNFSDSKTESDVHNKKACKYRINAEYLNESENAKCHHEINV
jgi:hypothetical protein